MIDRVVDYAALSAVAGLLTTGCLAATLRGPVADHATQAQVIANRCEVDCADVEAMAVQACLIAAIVNGDDGEECDTDR